MIEEEQWMNENRKVNITKATKSIRGNMHMAMQTRSTYVTRRSNLVPLFEALAFILLQCIYMHVDVAYLILAVCGYSGQPRICDRLY
jgi:hypothetical protein